jgi:hypothetical protein
MELGGLTEARDRGGMIPLLSGGSAFFVQPLRLRMLTYLLSATAFPRSDSGAVVQESNSLLIWPLFSLMRRITRS